MQQESARDRFPADVPLTTLTTYQGDIAALIAQELTDREIAAQLGLTASEVGNHIDEALQCLGMCRRYQIGVWAVRQRLHSGPR